MMPREGYETITLPTPISDDIQHFVDASKGLVSGKAEALKNAWMFYRQHRVPMNLLSPYEGKAPSVRIGNKNVGDEHTTFIIAEIGINHNGDLDLAKELIDIAVEAGCHAVKFQKRNPDVCVPENQKKLLRETPWGTMTYLEYKRRIEFGKEEYDEIDRYCKEKGIMWFASCWDLDSLAFIARYDPPCFKIASASITDTVLLRAHKETGKPIIISTGMSSIEEIRSAMDELGENNTVLLHCNSSYPAKNEELNLQMIRTYKSLFNVPVGYSGHETGIAPTVFSVVMGASVVERHITMDRAMWGTDHASAVEPQGLQKLVRDIEVYHVAKGDGIKRIYPSEVPIRKKLRG
jgi:N-acetylneuraminate synthase